MSLVQGKIKRKEWRKLCKKRRRKVVRQKAAKERDRLEEELQKEKDADPEYQKLLVEMLHQEEVAAGREALERALRNAQWLEEEHKAQQRFEQLRQQIETKEREEREKRERIRREFEERERRTEEARAERHRQQEEMVRLVRERHTKLQQFSATGIDDYLTELQMVHSTRADAVDCKFFTKTGTCRHGLRCSGNHPTPGLSKIILISNFFNHPALERTVHQEYGHDGRLEFDEEDLSNSFTDFFRDIVDEFERFGKIHQILVCRNFGLHLRGNVYIEYENMRHAAAAYLRMNGRFYAKKQLHVEFRSPIVWPAAVCGLFELKRCQKGPGCNFLHIFKNPDQRYQYDHFQQSRSMRKEASIVPATPLVLKSWDEITSGATQSSRNAVNWRWSESPEPEERVPGTKTNTGESVRDLESGKNDRRVRSHTRSDSGRRRSRSRRRRNSRSRSSSRRRQTSRSRSSSRRRRDSRSRSRSRNRSRSNSNHNDQGHRKKDSTRRKEHRSDSKRSDKYKRKRQSRSPSNASTRSSKDSKGKRRSSRDRDAKKDSPSKAKKREQQL